MYQLVVCAVFKNESHILDEWISHYLYHGAEHIYLVNDNSNDNYEEIINKYSNYVTLFNNDIETQNVGRQSLIYEKYFNNVLCQTKWITILDLDEFLYSPDNINLLNIIEKYNSYSQIKVNWLHFGSNGHLYQPRSTVQGFTSRASLDTSKIYYSYKSIVKASEVLFFGIHSHNIKNGNETDVSDLIINHYCIQSQDFYLRIKSTRGDINNWFEHVNLKRNLDLFKILDINDIYDDRLYKQNINLIKNISYTKDDVTIVLT